MYVCILSPLNLIPTHPTAGTDFSLNMHLQA